MSAVRIANRYARALFRLIKEDQGTASKLVPALEAITQLFDIDDARRVLVSPVMPSDLKLALIKYALKAADNKDADLEHFAESMVSAGRVDVFPEVVAAFKGIVNDKAGIITAQVEVVQAMDEAQQKTLRGQLKQLVNKEVEIQEKIRPEILGGFVVRFGNSLLDLSVRTKLNSIAKNAAI